MIEKKGRRFNTEDTERGAQRAQNAVAWGEQLRDGKKRLKNSHAQNRRMGHPAGIAKRAEERRIRITPTEITPPQR